MMDWGKETRALRTRTALADRIAADIPQALLALRSDTLAGDVVRKHRCRYSTALHAVALARAAEECRNG